MSWLSKGILDVIEKFSYDFYIVKQDPKVLCTCIKAGTNQPDPTCKKCLGLGNKIKIKKAHGASNEIQIPQGARIGEGLVRAKSYYFKYDVALGMNDLIIDGDEVFYVFRSENGKGFHGEPCLEKVMAVSKKFDQAVQLKNFYEIIGR
jgi:hypothetical protein